VARIQFPYYDREALQTPNVGAVLPWRVHGAVLLTFRISCSRASSCEDAATTSADSRVKSSLSDMVIYADRRERFAMRDFVGTITRDGLRGGCCLTSAFGSAAA